MKKIKVLLISLISMFAFNLNANAASSSLSVSSSNVYVGDSFTVTAYVSSSAAWNVHVNASGPVSGCTINKADASSDAMDTNRSFDATCTATGEGTIIIRLSGDVTSASDGNAVTVSGSRSVNVSQKPSPTPTPAPSQPSNNNKNNTNNQSSNNNSNKQNSTQNNDENKSKNNNIKNISVDGYNLIKIDSNNYTLSVPNDITNINIKATAEDSKSKVTGTGSHNINIGENNIEIVVIAENGLQNKINIKVTRKDGYYLEDLESILNNNKASDINITIKSDTVIKESDLEKIKNSKKTVKFNYYDNDKNLVYSWIIDGSQIKDISNLSTTITYDSENKSEMLKKSNYADALIISLKQNNLSSGIKLKLFVGNKYSNNDYVNIYSYKNNNLNLVTKKVKVSDGYIDFNIDNSSDYLITMSDVPNSDITIGVKKEKQTPIWPIIILIICLIVIGIMVALIIKKKRKKKNYDDDYEVLNEDNNLFNNGNPFNN